jgi:hypothetical protein
MNGTFVISSQPRAEVDQVAALQAALRHRQLDGAKQPQNEQEQDSGGFSGKV